MSRYVLYLDESEIPDEHGNRYFVIGGVIMRRGYHDNKFTLKMNEAKKKIWDNEEGCESHILHELDINNAFHHTNLDELEEYYLIFKQESKYKTAYKEVCSLMNDKNITTVAVCMNHSELEKHYDKTEMNDRFSVLMQLIIENYCHFLITHGGTGDIYYESLKKSQNEKIERRFCELKAIGTMYYSSHKVISLIKNLYFVDKKENCPGLQLADFVPNSLGRTQVGKDPKYTNLPKIVKKRLYAGKMGRKDKYGFKTIP